MRSRLLLILSFALTLNFSLVSLVQAKDKAETAEAAQKKNITVVILNAAPEVIHAAALQVLASIGCEIKKDTPLAIEGKRPNKIGLAVGSGGEKIFVTLQVEGEGKTELTVTTKKTLMGIAGQKLWNVEIATQISDATK